MSRWYFLGPFLALYVLGGCGAGNDVPPTFSTGVEVAFANENGAPCGEGAWQPAGKPAHIVVRAALVTESCRCEYRSAPQYSCSSSKECESEYDVGGENPQKCEAMDREVVTIEGATAFTDRSDCEVAVTFDASSARAAVQCSTGGYVVVHVTVLTNKGPKDDHYGVEFKDADMICPHVGADAGVGDGAAGADAGAATLGDGEAPDAEDRDAQAADAPEN